MTNTSFKYPDTLFKLPDKKELDIVCKIFQTSDIKTIDVEKELSKQILPLNGLFNNKLTYNQILEKILSKHNIPYKTDESLQVKEEKILLQKFRQILNNLSPEEKERIDQEI